MAIIFVGFAASLEGYTLLTVSRNRLRQKRAALITEYKAAAEKVLLITERHSTEK